MDKKYFPTPEEIKIVTDLYDGTSIRIDKIMRLTAHKYPRWYIKRLAGGLGLVKAKMPDWNEEEVEYIHRNYPRKSFVAMQRALKRMNGGVHRSHTAILLKAKREHINKRSDGLTMRMMEDLMGADHHKIERWLSLGLLTAKRKGTERKEAQGGDMWHFEPNRVREFIINNPEEIDLRRVEPLNFITLVAGRK